MRDNVVLQVSFKETLMILDSLERRAFDIKEVIRIVDSGYVIEASPQGSYGYLYIGIGKERNK